MWQQGQVFKLKTRGRDGQPLWAYRYRLEGRGSERPQVGGFASRAEAGAALEKVLLATARDLGPKGRDEMFGAGLMDAFRAVSAVAPSTDAALQLKH